MKIVTYTYEDKEQIGFIYNEDRVIRLSDIGVASEDVNQMLDKYTLEEVLSLYKNNLEDAKEKALPLGDVKLLAPIPRPKQDIICLGINYAAHAEESARYKKDAFKRGEEYPIYFSKRVNEAVADNMPIESHRDMFENLDYEVELAVVIGKPCRNVKKEDVEEYIFGYTIVNDMSAREIQTRHQQWYFGKSLDNFTPMGPCITTRDEIQYPPTLNIKSYVNGELRQDSTTALLINDIDHIVSELSQGMTLLPGTIIATGTPAGVGMGMTPPQFLKAGDVVKCEIEKIGNITNPIID